MRLGDLISGILRATESAYQDYRNAYLEDVESLHETPSTLPGTPTRMTVTNLNALAPTKIRLKATVYLSDNRSEIDASFADSWLRRGKPAELDIEFADSEPPEGICRIRDLENNFYEEKVKEVI